MKKFTRPLAALFMGIAGVATTPSPANADVAGSYILVERHIPAYNTGAPTDTEHHIPVDLYSSFGACKSSALQYYQSHICDKGHRCFVQYTCGDQMGVIAPPPIMYTPPPLWRSILGWK